MIKNKNFLDGKAYYIAPHNDISEKLNNYIRNLFPKALFKGYIDQKEEKGDFNANSLDQEFDYILILSPNYCEDISRVLRNNYVKSSQIIYVYSNNNYIYTKFQFYYELIKKYNNFKLLINNPVYLSNKLSLFIADKFSLKIFENEKNLASLKNKHKGKRAFIIGNGPSLKLEDLNKLKKEITFSANRIYLAFDEISWRPTYYSVEDNLVLSQNYEQINALNNTIKIFPNSLLKLKPPINNAIYFNFYQETFYPNQPKMSSNPFKGLYWGSTIVFTMIQLAVYMGINEIYLVGVDFNFVVPTGADQNPNELTCHGENNHFHKDYRKKGEKWNVPNLHIQERSFQSIKEFCAMNNIIIRNISRKSHLNIIEKANFDDIIID